MIFSDKTIKNTKPIIFYLLILPSFIWIASFINGTLGVNPIDKLTDELGQMALRLLVATLILSSISKFKYFRSLINFRRMIGLFAFYYVLLHFTTYIFLDHFFNWNFILKDILKRPFITFGFISFIFLIPLALTSTNYMIKKLTFKLWKKIHYLIYIAAPLSALHYLLLTKADKTEPIIYLTIIFIVLIWRFFLKKISF
jgi:Predicted membrane protein